MSVFSAAPKTDDSHRCAGRRGRDSFVFSAAPKTSGIPICVERRGWDSFTFSAAPKTEDRPVCELAVQQSTGLLDFMVRIPSIPRKKQTPSGVCYFLAERKGFEPLIRSPRIHDFQSCAFGQLSHLSTVGCLPVLVTNSFNIIQEWTPFVKWFPGISCLNFHRPGLRCRPREPAPQWAPPSGSRSRPLPPRR